MLTLSSSFKGLYLLSLTVLIPGHLTVDRLFLQVCANLSPSRLTLSYLSLRFIIMVGFY